MKKILLIEDDKDLNLGLTYDLRSEGYQVYSARNLGEGMALLEKQEVDLLLLDGQSARWRRVRLLQGGQNGR